MRLEDVVERSFAERGFAHQPDASAWRVHLFAPEDVGGTGGKAEAAVHALVHDGGLGCVVRVEGAGARRGGDLRERGLCGEARWLPVRAWLREDATSDASYEAAGVEDAGRDRTRA